MRGTNLIFEAICLVGLTACSPAARRNTAQVAGAAASGTSGGGSDSSTATKIMIFGGSEHKTYLGCLNCSEYAMDSVYNTYGQHGSSYSLESIWNHYSEYGSPYSTYSACNAYASDPPVIVDGTGNYYGRLSLNTYTPGLGAGTKFYEWLKNTVCAEN
jgi:hypothetical protein